MIFAIMLTIGTSLLLRQPIQAATEGYYTYTVADGEVTITGCDSSISGWITVPAELGGYPVTAIGNNGFYNCGKLRNVKIPDSVVTIGDNAFKYCSNMETIAIGDGVRYIGSYAFESCVYLTQITIPRSVTGMGNSVFRNCSSLNTATLGDGLTAISERVFEGCPQLASVTIPASVTKVGDYAFNYCRNLKDVYFLGERSQWNAISIGRNNSYLKNATLHIVKPTISQILIEALPDKTVYEVGEALDTTGLLLTAIYSNGSSQLVDNGFTVSGFDSSAAGSKSVTVTYDGQTVSFSVTVELPRKIEGNGVYYNSLAEAVEATQEGGKLKLLADIFGDVTVHKNVCLDLNGFDINGMVVVEAGCTLYCFDSQTDDYTVDDPYGYGKISGIIGDVQGLPLESALAEDGYLLVKEDDGVSFHRVTLRLTAMTLRASRVGVYYKSFMAGDESAASYVQSFGVALSVVAIPSSENMETYCGYSVFRDFGCNDGGNVISTFLRDIIKTTNSVEKNAARAAMPIYGRAYILTKDGQYLFGAAVSRSFQEQVEEVDAMWSQLTFQQQMEVATMYQTYFNVMQNWNLPNLQAAISPQVAVVTRKKELALA